MQYFIYLMVFFSGLTGLIYQVTWQKYLSIYLGSHSLSTTLTLSCFFLFLAAGYHFISKYGHRLGRNRIKTYGYIEGAIGVYAIVSPSLFFSIYKVWPSYPSDSFAHFVMSFLFALSLMGLPTFLMGATIPLLTQGLSRKLEEGHQVHAWVYGVNTFGAFFGSLFAGFYMLEFLGLAQTLNITGVINCLVFLFLLVFSKFSSENFEGYTPPKEVKQPQSATRTSRRLLSVAFLSGFLSFGVESLVIRMAGLSLGSSNYTYSMIVSAFIASIAIGSFLAAAVKDKWGLRVLVATQSALFLSLVGLYLAIPHWPDCVARLTMIFAQSPINFNLYWVSIFIAFFFTLTIPVSLLGITLPLLFQQLKNQGSFLNQTAGKMYAWNSVGAGLGAILGGYLLFMIMDAHQIFLLLIVVALINIGLIAHTNWKSSGKLTAALVTLALLLLTLPNWSDSQFVPSRFNGGVVPNTQKQLAEYFQDLNNQNPDNPTKFLYSDFGVNTYTVVTEDSLGNRSLYVNAKPDASTNGDHYTRAMTALFPLALSSKVEDIFIVGLGTGMSTGIAASVPMNKKVSVAEISRGAVEALPYFSKWNFGIEKFMGKISIDNDDAYKVLKNGTKKYDLIFSEPSNTWVAGVEKIYTKEFLAMAASKLNADGTYSQWFPLFQMSEPGFLSILKNFRSVFKNVTLWNAGNGMATIILARNKPFAFGPNHFQEKNIALKPILDELKIKDSKHLLMQQIFSNSDTDILISHSQIEHSLYHPRLAYESGRARFSQSAVYLSTITEKYFLPLDEDVPANTDLLWQTHLDSLDKTFFKAARDAFSNQPNLGHLIGRLSLSENKLYPSKDKNKKKWAQYDYLQSPKPGVTPGPESKEKGIFRELFTRYNRLREIRAEGYLKNVVRTAPKSCETDDCFGIKAKILAKVGESRALRLEEDLGRANKAEAKVELEHLFEQKVRIE